jgi:hypothetical protein
MGEVSLTMKKVMGEIKGFKPTVIIGAFCYSNLQTGDVKKELTANNYPEYKIKSGVKGELDQAEISEFMEEKNKDSSGRIL